MNSTFESVPGLTLEACNTNENPITLADIPEFFLSLLTLNNGDTYLYDKKKFFSIYFPFSNNIGSVITVNQYEIKPGDSLNLANFPLVIKAITGKCHLIVSGFNKLLIKNNEATSISLLKQSEIYKVSKPWGHELWLNNNFGSDYYSFKEVFIKQGFQTSLQYHEKKIECALLYEGRCKVFFGSLIEEDRQIAKDSLSFKILNPYSKIFIQPLTTHRMNALSDMYHYEISTPELDDVIRLSDDTNRGHGRIHDEHKKI